MFGDALIHMNAFIDYLASKNLVFEVTNKLENNTSVIQANKSSTFVIYHIAVALVVGMAISRSVLIASVDFTIVVWPIFFFIQSLSVLALMKYGVLKGG